MKQKRVSAIALSAAAAAMLTFSGRGGGGGGSAGVASPAAPTTPTTPTTTAALQQPALIVAAEPTANGATKTHAFFAELETWTDTTVNTKAGAKPTVDLATAISGGGTVNLVNTNLYSINGNVVIPAGVTLNIPAGTILFGETASSYLVVEKGATLNVSGATNDPVIFTSKNDVTTGSALTAAGEWGGVSIFGTATTNKGVVNYEAGSFTFGGSNDAEGSSTIENMVIMHSGYEVEVDAELNGLSLGGVGTGTTID
ncbi:MAG: hypothetical protein R3302_06565, partial [Sulfurimonadaceae bacterium]|nr:hypothetical protein [Sulfurimonadaceae bacterium]